MSNMKGPSGIYSHSTMHAQLLAYASTLPPSHYLSHVAHLFSSLPQSISVSTYIIFSPISPHLNLLHPRTLSRRSSCDFTNRLLDEGTEAEVLATKIQIKKQLGLLATKELSDSPPVDAAVHFYANTQALGEVVNSFASVTASSSFPPLCQAQVRDEGI